MFFSFFTARFSPFHRKLMLTGSADGADGWSSCISSLKSESGFQKCLWARTEWEVYWRWRKGIVNCGKLQLQISRIPSEYTKMLLHKGLICHLPGSVKLFDVLQQRAIQTFFPPSKHSPKWSIHVSHRTVFLKLWCISQRKFMPRLEGFLSRTRYIIWASCLSPAEVPFDMRSFRSCVVLRKAFLSFCMTCSSTRSLYSWHKEMLCLELALNFEQWHQALRLCGCDGDGRQAQVAGCAV